MELRIEAGTRIGPCVFVEVSSGPESDSEPETEEESEEDEEEEEDGKDGLEGLSLLLAGLIMFGLMALGWGSVLSAAGMDVDGAWVGDVVVSFFCGACW